MTAVQKQPEETKALSPENARFLRMAKDRLDQLDKSASFTGKLSSILGGVFLTALFLDFHITGGITMFLAASAAKSYYETDAERKHLKKAQELLEKESPETILQHKEQKNTSYSKHFEAVSSIAIWGGLALMFAKSIALLPLIGASAAVIGMGIGIEAGRFSGALKACKTIRDLAKKSGLSLKPKTRAPETPTQAATKLEKGQSKDFNATATTPDQTTEAPDAHKSENENSRPQQKDQPRR